MQYNKDQQYKKRDGGSRLAAIRVRDIDDSLEWFGNYTPHGDIPIILIPERNSCAGYIYIPEGTYAIITRHGMFQEVRKHGGVYACLPWTKIQYLVTQQNIVYDLPVKSCPTFDNIFADIDIAVVFRCRDDDESIKQFVYNISINQLNEQLEAAITERLRVLIRERTHLEIYQIKGREHTQEMLDFLNGMFRTKGLEFTRIIITNVKLPQDIADPLDKKAQYGSMNEYERTRHEFDMRLLSDDLTLELLKIGKENEREQERNLFRKNFALVEREYRVITGETAKSVAEINETTEAEKKRISAESELQAQTIRAGIKILESNLTATGRAEAQQIDVQASNYSQLRTAEQMAKVADKNAEVTKLEGQAEGELAKVLFSRRWFQYLNSKLEVIKELGGNINAKIFGSQGGDPLAQIGALGLLKNNQQPLLNR